MSSRVCLIIYDLPVYISSCLFSWMLSGLLVIPGVSCLWVLPCPVMSCLDVLIKYFHLSLYPRLRVPVPPSCVHRDRRPDQNPKRRPFTPFCFPFWQVFYFVPVFVYVCPAAWKSPLVIPAIAHCKSAWEFGGIAASATSPLAASPHARRLREISVDSLPSSRVAAPPGAPFAGDHATGSPLTQCPPHRLWLNARRPASDSMPAGPPLS